MWTIKHHKQFEEQICTKCPADINRDYTLCAKCRRAQDFEAGYEACKKKRKRVTHRVNSNDQLTKAKELLTRFVIASVYFNGKEADLVQEAEQFLKGQRK